MVSSLVLSIMLIISTPGRLKSFVSILIDQVEQAPEYQLQGRSIVHHSPSIPQELRESHFNLRSDTPNIGPQVVNSFFSFAPHPRVFARFSATSRTFSLRLRCLVPTPTLPGGHTCTKNKTS